MIEKMPWLARGGHRPHVPWPARSPRSASRCARSPASASLPGPLSVRCRKCPATFQLARQRIAVLVAKRCAMLHVAEEDVSRVKYPCAGCPGQCWPGCVPDTSLANASRQVLGDDNRSARQFTIGHRESGVCDSRIDLLPCAGEGRGRENGHDVDDQGCLDSHPRWDQNSSGSTSRCQRSREGDLIASSWLTQWPRKRCKARRDGDSTSSWPRSRLALRERRIGTGS